MSLEHELGLRKPIELLPHRALLNIYFTASCLKKRADEFFRSFGLTDVQFNVMILLCHQSGPEGGLSQAQLSDMMLVNRANITSLIDRMEKAELVVRTAAANDRRYNIVKLTPRGKKLFARVEPLYAKQVGQIMAVVKKPEQKRLIAMLEKVRSELVT
ncbi:MAG: MarR family winged helix-turn-helix transcriptional regulator [Planctomycetota bacterium]|jgi:MarR family 2-MHQ and catechol resistance regulon transcriptional repressor